VKKSTRDDKEGWTRHSTTDRGEPRRDDHDHDSSVELWPGEAVVPDGVEEGETVLGGQHEHGTVGVLGVPDPEHRT
jgi:hypothetical protein